MEETTGSKRPREETQLQELDFEEHSKRHKPYNHILSLLESEEEDSSEDLSSLITTLQQEITCACTPDTLLSPAQENDQDNPTTTTTTLEDYSASASSSPPQSEIGALKEDEEDDKERIMRHLLEASDDELGIPNGGDGLMDFSEDGFNGRDGFSSFGNGLWELEDETANYYTLLLSELLPY